MEEKILFQRLCLLYDPPKQGTACSKLATKTQDRVYHALRCIALSVNKNDKQIVYKLISSQDYG